MPTFEFPSPGAPVSRLIEAHPEDLAEHHAWHDHGPEVFLEIEGRWFLAFEVTEFDPADYEE